MLSVATNQVFGGICPFMVSYLINENFFIDRRLRCRQSKSQQNGNLHAREQHVIRTMGKVLGEILRIRLTRVRLLWAKVVINICSRARDNEKSIWRKHCKMKLVFKRISGELCSLVLMRPKRLRLNRCLPGKAIKCAHLVLKHAFNLYFPRTRFNFLGKLGAGGKGGSGEE